MHARTRLPPWLLIIAGAATAHALTYLAVHGFRHGGDVIGVHGFHPGVAAGLLGMSLVVVALPMPSQGRSLDDRLTLRATLPWQVTLYAAVLMAEWIGASVSATVVIHDPWVWVGIAANVVVAGMLTGLARVIRTAVGSWGSLEWHRPAAPQTQRWQCTSWTVPVSAGPLASGGCRAPPAAC